jgi:hypothetical protein
VWDDRLGAQRTCPDKFHRPGATPRARSTDPGTSHAAARSIKGVTLPNQRAVLRVFRELHAFGGMTDEELLAQYRAHARSLSLPNQSDSGLRTRRRELTDAGYLRDSGLTKILPSRRRAIVWELSP